MTELTFLIDLLLKHKLDDDTKDALAARIRDVEAALTAPVVTSGYVQATFGPVSSVGQQSVTRVTEIGQTPAAQAAIASREQAIAESLSGKINKETGRPRKF